MKFRLSLLFVLSWFISLGQTPPLQPGFGPGGSDYLHNGVIFSDFTTLFSGEGYWLFEPNNPKPDSADVIVFNHGYGVFNPGPYGQWIEHLVRKGNIVIFPKYQVSDLSLPNTYTPNAVIGIQDAFDELQSNPNRVKPRMEHYGMIGHSYGGVVTSNIVTEYAAYGLPKPQCFMLCQPGTGGLNAGRLTTYTGMDVDYNVLIVVGNDDVIVGDAFGREIMDSTDISTDHKNYITHFADNLGTPIIEASHNEPLAANNDYDGGTVSTVITGGYLASKIDAVDYYCYWKLADALLACTFYGNFCNYAFGDTPQQNNMGAWSDGTSVIPLEVEPSSFVSIDERSMDNEGMLFPNPSHNQIEVVSNSEKKNNYIIYDNKGQMVLENEFNFTTTIDISMLNSGLYIMKMVSDHQVKQFKFIKE